MVGENIKKIYVCKNFDSTKLLTWEEHLNTEKPAS